MTGIGTGTYTVMTHLFCCPTAWDGIAGVASAAIRSRAKSLNGRPVGNMRYGCRTLGSGIAK